MVEIKSTRPSESALNITPLVDIVFLLLIFFLLTAFFVEPQGLGVELPEAEGAPVAEQEELVVVIDKHENITIKEVPVALSDLEKEVSGFLENHPDSAVVIKSDRAVKLDAVVKAMDRCKKGGAKELVIATEAPPPSP
ncbi:MAG: biopolymer transporter ExbD [bacterium]